MTPPNQQPLATTGTCPVTDRSGCGISCVAFITGKSYAEVRQIYLHQCGGDERQLTAVGNGAGLNSPTLLKLLEACGGKAWVKPIATMPTIQMVRREHGCGHWIVITEDGDVFDPAPLPTSIEDDDSIKGTCPVCGAKDGLACDMRGDYRFYPLLIRGDDWTHQARIDAAKDIFNAASILPGRPATKEEHEATAEAFEKQDAAKKKEN